MLGGALITAFSYGFWLLIDRRLKGEQISLNPFQKTRKAGTGVLGSLKAANTPKSTTKTIGVT